MMIFLSLNGMLAFFHNVCNFFYIVLTEVMKMAVIYFSFHRRTCHQTVYRYHYSQVLVTKLNISTEWFLYAEVWFT